MVHGAARLPRTVGYTWLLPFHSVMPYGRASAEEGVAGACIGTPAGQERLVRSRMGRCVGRGAEAKVLRKLGVRAAMDWMAWRLDEQRRVDDAFYHGEEGGEREKVRSAARAHILPDELGIIALELVYELAIG